MMRESDSIILRQFVSRVRRLFPEARIWAFGSRARGEASSESDFDVCIVIPDADGDGKGRVQRIAWEVGFEHGLVITALCYDEAEFTQGPRAASPLVRTILREGVVA